MNKNSIGHLLRTSWEYFAPPPPPKVSEKKWSGTDRSVDMQTDG